MNRNTEAANWGIIPRLVGGSPNAIDKTLQKYGVKGGLPPLRR